MKLDQAVIECITINKDGQERMKEHDKELSLRN